MSAQSPQRLTLARRRESLAARGFVWFQRVVAAGCLVSGVVWWARIVGLNAGASLAARFDLMPPAWQAASATLAMFFPFAALGLWMLASWGPVIWLICAATEVTMHGVFPGLFGANRLALVTHGLTALLYLAFRVVLFRQKRAALVSRN